jgi:hypothetical protein
MITRAVVVLHVSFDTHFFVELLMIPGSHFWVVGRGEGWNGSLKSTEPDISSLEHTIILKRLADKEKYTHKKENNPASSSKD